MRKQSVYNSLSEIKFPSVSVNQSSLFATNEKTRTSLTASVAEQKA